MHFYYNGGLPLKFGRRAYGLFSYDIMCIKCLKTIRLLSTCFLHMFIHRKHNMIKLYEESGKVKYSTNDFFGKTYHTRCLSQCRNHFPEQNINLKINLGRSALRINGFYLAIFTHH